MNERYIKIISDDTKSLVHFMDGTNCHMTLVLSAPSIGIWSYNWCVRGDLPSPISVLAHSP